MFNPGAFLGLPPPQEGGSKISETHWDFLGRSRVTQELAIKLRPWCGLAGDLHAHMLLLEGLDLVGLHEFPAGLVPPHGQCWR